MSKPEITIGSGNVFADLGVKDPENAKIKAGLVVQITEILRERELLDRQAKVAEILGIDQPKVSKLLRGRLSEFSETRLMNFLTRLGSDIEIVVHREPKKANARGEVCVVAG